MLILEDPNGCDNEELKALRAEIAKVAQPIFDLIASYEKKIIAVLGLLKEYFHLDNEEKLAEKGFTSVHYNEMYQEDLLELVNPETYLTGLAKIAATSRYDFEAPQTKLPIRMDSTKNLFYVPDNAGLSPQGLIYFQQLCGLLNVLGNVFSLKSFLHMSVAHPYCDTEACQQFRDEAHQLARKMTPNMDSLATIREMDASINALITPSEELAGEYFSWMLETTADLSTAVDKARSLIQALYLQFPRETYVLASDFQNLLKNVANQLFDSNYQTRWVADELIIPENIISDLLERWPKLHDVMAVQVPKFKEQLITQAKIEMAKCDASVRIQAAKHGFILEASNSGGGLLTGELYRLWNSRQKAAAVEAEAAAEVHRPGNGGG